MKQNLVALILKASEIKLTDGHGYIDKAVDADSDIHFQHKAILPIYPMYLGRKVYIVCKQAFIGYKITTIYENGDFLEHWRNGCEMFRMFIKEIDIVLASWNSIDNFDKLYSFPLIKIDFWLIYCNSFFWSKFLRAVKLYSFV